MLKRKSEEHGVRVAASAKRVALKGDPEGDAEGAGEGSQADPGERGPQEASQDPPQAHDPNYTHLRMLCTLREASQIVGKGGSTIKHVKEATSSKVNVSENLRGVHERVVHVRGNIEAVSAAFGLLARVLVDEPEGVPSSRDSACLTVQLLVPHQYMGYVIGKSGSKFKEIENASAATLIASPSTMPLSTDRCLSVTGVADAVHIAVYYIAQVILQYKPLINSRIVFYDPINSIQHQKLLQQHTLRTSGLHMPEGLPLNPLWNTHNPDFSDMSSTIISSNTMIPQFDFLSITRDPHSNNITEEIMIPNEFVGNIIGKNGKTIKKIKEASQCKIQISDFDSNFPNERKVTFTGSNAANQTAIFLVTDKIEKDRKSTD